MGNGGSPDHPEDSGCTEEEIKHRRERGKLAQRAFRQRQIVTIRELKDENKRLRDVILAISQAASGSRAALDRAIAEARKAIGVDDAVTDNISLELEVTHSPLENLPNAVGVSNRESATPCLEKSYDLEIVQPQTTSMEVADFLPWLNPLEGSAGESPAPIIPHQLGSHYSEYCSTDTELQQMARPEPGRCLKVARPPSDIIPFLGPAAYTVAGQIHWVAMAYNYSAVKALTCPNPPADAIALASSAFGRILKLIPLMDLLKCMHWRLGFRKYGTINDNLLGSDAERLGELYVTIVEEYGIRSKEYTMNAFDVERKLREELGTGFATFEATLCRRANSQLTPRMKQIMMILASKAVCYGNGPTWAPDMIPGVARLWLDDT